MLQINNLKVKVADKEILHGVNLNVNKGETHVIMGPNGAGKSTLGYAIMGNPKYEVTEGSILFKEGRNIPFIPESYRGSWNLTFKLYQKCG